MSFGLIEEFEQFLVAERRSSFNTIRGYLTDIKIFFQFIKKKGKKIFDSNSNDCEEFISNQLKKGHSSLTLARRASSLKVLSEFLKLKRNFILMQRKILPVKLSKSIPKFLTEEEVYQIFEQACRESSTLRGMRNRVILSLLYSAGLRVSELISLRLSDIDFDFSVLKNSWKRWQR